MSLSFKLRSTNDLMQVTKALQAFSPSIRKLSLLMPVSDNIAYLAPEPIQHRTKFPCLEELAIECDDMPSALVHTMLLSNKCGGLRALKTLCLHQMCWKYDDFRTCTKDLSVSTLILSMIGPGSRDNGIGWTAANDIVKNLFKNNSLKIIRARYLPGVCESSKYKVFRLPVSMVSC